MKTPKHTSSLRKVTVVAACSGIMLMQAPTTVAASAFVGATEFTQIANNLQLGLIQATGIEQIVNQVTQIYNQIQAYKNMLQNTKNLVKNDIAKLTGTLNDLKGVVDKAKGLSFTAASIDKLFSDTHKGYTDYSAAAIGPGGFQDAYKKWQGLHEETTKSALEELKLQSKNFEDEASTIAAIQDKLSTTEGTVQAVNVASEVALQQVNQLQMLRQLMMSQQQTQTRYAAIQAEKDQMMAAQSEIKAKGNKSTQGNETTF